jgi:hypothetical protein
MGRCKKDGNYSPSKNKLVQDSEGNEENGYPVLDPNKTKIDYPKEPNEVHKNTLKSCKKSLKISGDITRQSQTKCTGSTQEIPRQ